MAAGQVDLDDPANTLALFRLNSVVGVKGFFNDAKQLTGMGIHCALCHSTVDDSFAPGIGRRLDGWPNRDLNVGAIINLAPDVSALTNALEVDEETVRTVLQSWGRDGPKAKSLARYHPLPSGAQSKDLSPSATRGGS